jgi:hypothetical protein
MGGCLAWHLCSACPDEGSIRLESQVNAARMCAINDKRPRPPHLPGKADEEDGVFREID